MARLTTHDCNAMLDRGAVVSVGSASIIATLRSSDPHGRKSILRQRIIRSSFIHQVPTVATRPYNKRSWELNKVAPRIGRVKPSQGISREAV